jgi:hypothetical protein
VFIILILKEKKLELPVPENSTEFIYNLFGFAKKYEEI